MQQIGRYTIQGELGRGAMGIVYRALDPTIGRTIAIKTIRLSDLTEPSERDRLRDRLFREAQSAGILSHPNIVTIYDILEEAGMAYIFMEYVNGPTFEKMLEGHQVPAGETILSVFRQTASALDYAHRKGIVHRDIKPANIMIHDDGEAKVTDFGVAKIVSQQMTQTGTMMGTPSYMSPEQIQGVNIDGRADQFSLAVIVYEVLTGEKPFVAEYLPSLLYKICREDPAPPQRLNTSLGPTVDTVIRRALAKSHEDRFPTCTEFIRELDKACAATPDWMPLARGASQNMPTVLVTSAVPLTPAAVPPPPEPPAKVPPVEPATIPPVEAAPPKPQPPPPAVTAAPVPPPVTPQPVPVTPRAPVRLEEQQNNTVRNVVLALGSIVIMALAFLIFQKWSAKDRPTIPADQTSTTAQTDQPPVTPSQPDKTAQQKPVQQPAQQPVKDIDKPSPLTAEPKTVHPSDPKIPVPTAGEIAIQFNSIPIGARIVVDGNPEKACTTPCSIPLSKDRHTLTAKAAGFRDANRIFNTPQESTVDVSLDAQTGTLSVSTTPPGATIVLNGQTRPEKTPAVLKLAAGSYRLQVVKDSLKTDEETVEIKDGGLSQRRYTLE